MGRSLYCMLWQWGGDGVGRVSCSKLMNDDDVEDVGPGGGKEGGKGDEEAREQHQVILEIVLGAWLCQSLPCFVCFDRMYLRLFDGRTLGSRKILRQPPPLTTSVRFCCSVYSSGCASRL